MYEDGFGLRLAVNSDGLISLEELEANLSEETALVSIMTVNNEIGVLQPVQEIGKLCRLDEKIKEKDCGDYEDYGEKTMNREKYGWNEIITRTLQGQQGVLPH